MLGFPLQIERKEKRERNLLVAKEISKFFNGYLAGSKYDRERKGKFCHAHDRSGNRILGSKA